MKVRGGNDYFLESVIARFMRRAAICKEEGRVGERTIFLDRAGELKEQLRKEQSERGSRVLRELGMGM